MIEPVEYLARAHANLFGLDAHFGQVRGDLFAVQTGQAYAAIGREARERCGRGVIKKGRGHGEMRYRAGRT